MFALDMPKRLSFIFGPLTCDTRKANPARKGSFTPLARHVRNRDLSRIAPLISVSRTETRIPHSITEPRREIDGGAKVNQDGERRHSLDQHLQKIICNHRQWTRLLSARQHLHVFCELCFGDWSHPILNRQTRPICPALPQR